MVEKKKASDYVFFGFVFVLLLVLGVSILYPFLNSIAISLNDANDTTKGGITIYPRAFTLKNYQLILQNPKIYNAYFITIARTAIGTFLGLLFTATLAYGLSVKKLMGKKFYTFMCLIPMYFSGGIIPSYFLMKSLHLTNTFWVYIIPNLVGLWNMILMRTFFQGMPEALEESARLDGASYFRIFFSIILPLSGTIMATIALFIGVMHWNSWFDAAMYIQKESLKPIQSVLVSIVNEAKYAEKLSEMGASNISDMGRGQNTNVRSITMATMVITILPIVLTYPFLQKYFVKGVMVGSVKG